MRDGMLLTALGLVIGAAVSVGATGMLRHMLFRVSIHDPLAFAASATLLVVVALLACWSPARRAARTEPILVLRAE
jgi:putative ABC transport system permease protein